MKHPTSKSSSTEPALRKGELHPVITAALPQFQPSKPDGSTSQEALNMSTEQIPAVKPKLNEEDMSPEQRAYIESLKAQKADPTPETTPEQAGSAGAAGPSKLPEAVSNPPQSPASAPMPTVQQAPPKSPPPAASTQPAQGAASPQKAPAAAPRPGHRPEGYIDLEKFLHMAIAQGVSDIHLRVGHPPMMRKDGEIVYTKLPPLSLNAMELFIRNVLPISVVDKMKGQMDFDFSFEIPGMARFRCNLFHELNNPGLVLRIIQMRIPQLEELGLPAMLARFTEFSRGIVLVTGPTGSGKSTTLAAMLDTINRNHAKHMITLEDPIEYVYTPKRCAITQRQLGTDTASFPSGVKYALRQDPDIILIGELRDRETILAALHAAETGHMVYSTLHTNDAVQTINRIINAFEPHERESVREQLGDIIQGTIAQRLLKRSGGVTGRVPIAEVMLVTPAIRDYIKNGEIDSIYELIRSNDYDGMCSMNLSLFRAHKNGLIDFEEALKISYDPNELQQMVRGAFHGQNGSS